MRSFLPGVKTWRNSHFLKSLSKLYAHELDAKEIEEKGHDHKTVASWYGITYEPKNNLDKFN